MQENLMIHILLLKMPVTHIRCRLQVKVVVRNIKILFNQIPNMWFKVCLPFFPESLVLKSIVAGPVPKSLQCCTLTLPLPQSSSLYVYV